MSEIKSLPAQPESPALPEEPPISIPSLPVSLQIFFNDSLFRRCQTVANYLAKAEGYAPRHLIGKPEACFAVVSRALTWRLDPYAVAQATYQTPGGQVGYYGSLCQAIIENSGRLDPSYGGVKFEHIGDWQKLRVGANGRMFKMATGQRGGEYPVPAWEQWGPLEEGLGVIVRAKLRDENNAREMPFDLLQAYPRNSTLWATDPRTQICYTSVRRFATSTVPTLFMGVPFDHETMDDWIAGLRDVTPAAPELGDFTESGAPRRGRRRTTAAEPEPAMPQTSDSEAIGTAAGVGAASGVTEVIAKPYFFADEVGEVFESADFEQAVTLYAERLEAAKADPRLLEALWQNGAALLAALREHGHETAADALNSEYGRLVEEAEGAEKRSAQPVATTDVSRETSGGGPAYDVAVPLPEGMPINQWHMSAREKLKAMAAAARPPEDYVRFRETNKAALERLRGELRAWHTMLHNEINSKMAGAG
jgi:hypothetical protein